MLNNDKNIGGDVETSIYGVSNITKNQRRNELRLYNDATLKFKNKYRIPSARLKGWNYSNPGFYFVTINCYQHENYFGEIKNNIMGLSYMGIIAHRFWENIPQHFPNVELDEYIIMPNHVHGIIWIREEDNDKNSNVTCRDVDSSRLENTNDQDAMNGVSTLAIKKKRGGITGEHNPILNKKSLGETIRSYKASVTHAIRNLYPEYKLFTWQSRFHDYIIQNEKELEKIRNYIRYNPLKWEQDQYFKKTQYRRDAIHRVS